MGYLALKFVWCVVAGRREGCPFPPPLLLTTYGRLENWALSLTGCNTQERRPCIVTRQHGRAGLALFWGVVGESFPRI